MIGVDNPTANEVAFFGPFRLSSVGRALYRGDDPVVLGSRALDILVALVARAGEVVSRRELIKQVWPDLVVEEANLRVHIAHLRKALGDGQDGARYVTNIPGRGYCFVAPVLRATGAPAPAEHAVETPVSAAPAHLPEKLVRMVGRGETVAALSKLLVSHRFVSVVGPGGMGKTTVAVSVAHALLDDFGNAVFFVDLGTLSNGALVSSTVASALGFVPQAEDPLPGLLAFLAGRRLLLILDSCEHVIDAAATLAERLFSRAPELHILTTSRESLRAEGEHIHLLRPLDYPSPGIDPTAGQALACPAVQLFMERAIASGYRFELTDRDAPIVAEICRRLDGLALAIELAASRVGTYGIQGLAELLENRFKLLWQGRRSALPRHQTMHATLDWSYNLLSEEDRRVLCRLSIFAGIFTLDAAQTIVADAEAPAWQVADALASLVNKSLIGTSVFAGTTYHRLLDSTRTYAALKLAESGEDEEVARRHATYYMESLSPRVIGGTLFRGHSTTVDAPHIGNIRAALEWSFSRPSANRIAVELAARSVRLFLGLSLLGECRRWCEQGLAGLVETERGTMKELALQEALAISGMFTLGNGEEIRTAIERGLGLAEALGSGEHQLHLLAGLHIFLTRIGDFRGAVAVAERSAAIALEVGDLGAVIMTDWMLGTAHHLAGDQEQAQLHCELGFKRVVTAGQIHVDFFGYDHRVRALIVLARVLWLRGSPDEAARMARQAVDEAERRDHPVTLSIALIYTATVSLWSGDFAVTEERIERLIAHAEKHSLKPYSAVGLGLRGELAIARREAAAGVELLRGVLPDLYAEQHHILTTAFSRALAEGLAQNGHAAEALATIDGAIAGTEGAETYELPNLLRARGEIFLAQPQPDAAAAENALRQSLKHAHAQSALAWELRAAIPLARLWQSLGRDDEARDLLAGLLERFSEGTNSADLRAATHLLKQLEQPDPQI